MPRRRPARARPSHCRGLRDDLQARIALDRAYVEALRDGREVVDPRFGDEADPDWQWVGYIHEGQVAALAQNNVSD